MSSTTRVVPFHPGHAHLIDPDAEEVAMRMSRDRIILQAQHGFSQTIIVDGFVSAVGGVVDLGSGLGEIWMVASARVRARPVLLTRTAMRMIAYTMQSYPLRRLQCHVKTSDMRAMKWANAIGFTREATLRSYGSDGSDYDILAIVRQS